MSDENRDAAGHTTAGLFDRLVAGDKNAVNELVTHFKDRLRRQTKTMFADKDRLRNLYETNDILQGAAVRLLKTLQEVKPATPGHFMRLAAQAVRRELRDLARKDYGPHGDGKNVYGQQPGGERDALLGGEADEGAGPQTRAVATELEARFHEAVGELPEPELEVFELIHYGGHTHQEVADRLGVSASTVKRRWHDARDRLHAMLRGTGPTTGAPPQD